VITLYALAGWDPLVRLFFWIGTTGGYGILLLLALTSVAVVVFFARDPRGEHPLVRVVAPALSALALAGMAVEAIGSYATLLGVADGAAESRLLPAAYLVVAVAGLVLAAVLRSRRPGIYAGIGGGHLTAAAGPPLIPAVPDPAPAPGGLYGNTGGWR